MLTPLGALQYQVLVCIQKKINKEIGEIISTYCHGSNTELFFNSLIKIYT